MGSLLFYGNLQEVIVIFSMSYGYSSNIVPTGKVCLGVTAQQTRRVFDFS